MPNYYEIIENGEDVNQIVNEINSKLSDWKNKFENIKEKSSAETKGDAIKANDSNQIETIEPAVKKPTEVVVEIGRAHV